MINQHPTDFAIANRMAFRIVGKTTIITHPKTDSLEARTLNFQGYTVEKINFDQNGGLEAHYAPVVDRAAERKQREEDIEYVYRNRLA